MKNIEGEEKQDEDLCHSSTLRSRRKGTSAKEVGVDTGEWSISEPKKVSSHPEK